MIKNITKGEYKFGSPEWDDISELPKDLVSIKETSSPNFCTDDYFSDFEMMPSNRHLICFSK